MVEGSLINAAVLVIALITVGLACYRIGLQAGRFEGRMTALIEEDERSLRPPESMAFLAELDGQVPVYDAHPADVPAARRAR